MSHLCQSIYTLSSASSCNYQSILAAIFSPKQTDNQNDLRGRVFIFGTTNKSIMGSNGDEIGIFCCCCCRCVSSKTTHAGQNGRCSVWYYITFRQVASTPKFSSNQRFLQQQQLAFFNPEARTTSFTFCEKGLMQNLLLELSHLLVEHSTILWEWILQHWLVVLSK